VDSAEIERGSLETMALERTRIFFTKARSAGFQQKFSLSFSEDWRGLF